MTETRIRFPGQGSQSVGMMAAYGDDAVIRATFDEASAALGEDLWAGGRRSGRALSLTVNTQPLMLTAGVAVYRVAGLAVPDVRTWWPATASANTPRWWRPTCSNWRMPCRWLSCAPRPCRTPCRPATAPWRRCSALTPGVVACCAEAAQGQVVQAVNFNSPEQTVIAGHKPRSREPMTLLSELRGAKRTRCAAGQRAVPLRADAARGRRSQGRPCRHRIQPPKITLVNNVDVARRRTRGDPRRAGAPGRGAGALGRDHAAHACRRVHPCRFECGPGKVLAGLTKRIDRRLTGVAMNDAAAIEATGATDRS
jgi:[acyl-carrier-protein] S-malonyltransferase